jgi:hypothetical protein
MPLVLKRNDQLDANDRFRVLSGKAVVGVLMRVPSGEKAGWWHWSITGFFVSPEDLGPSAGMSPSQEEAMADFAKRWRRNPNESALELGAESKPWGSRLQANTTVGIPPDWQAGNCRSPKIALM